jgi:hypothetical protein
MPVMREDSIDRLDACGMRIRRVCLDLEHNYTEMINKVSACMDLDPEERKQVFRGIISDVDKQSDLLDKFTNFSEQLIEIWSCFRQDCMNNGVEENDCYAREVAEIFAQLFSEDRRFFRRCQSYQSLLFQIMNEFKSE